ncbi:2-keto-4-pentenoate hydratase/2-oxohepta-3-ene-1,7-dioic acid hydratase (catechol pathway) [Brevibacterium iodinum ATCC 49514]|uniref:2-keto-4-pentenoate hydratase/2-oxohepta-3-ene-1,7-dioic acid hydratase (Catechol pathway) n=1 Tax=Brevibacterium iodinum ATCC 49514 TaxID=1255616 RepID=A0A2H1K7L9_9MICO|nr:fumarylacetoacetate hydrolase family protein [Brevibacterium iodinum]SMX95771.1 2-keto-4-pentenoate hydratase/2-oxohepta-3-ene-1,7-dioic acid hydratase (catechol pathway) [Brevibacterium iodinum ATCC 49514]SUW11299.1 Homoprotocatechuate catabolism bifunctional isomerase/decarboxylase [Brevibacterium iodinum]
MSTPAGVPDRPGKIIAVHVAYESRAAQRGRRPAQPSYFLKAASSVAASGQTIERPAGTSLLAFEGEIAIVIGTLARNVTEADAWSHVAGVTAANDFGLYDMKIPDKGSNVRSKSRDGYTPLGPELIPAAEAAPDSLRIRTWVNGDVVQDDGTRADQLIFTLPRIVADLSQHLTLEPGDVILTGTPVGSSVVDPGDTVEVEVTAAAANGGQLSSGRLTTTVVDGPSSFDENLGSVPAVDEALTVDAWGSREAAGLAPEDGAADTASKALGDDLIAKLTDAPTAGLSAQLRARGLNNVVIEGVAPLKPGSKIVGTAKTLRFVPNREDLFTSHGGGFNAQKQAFDSIRPGEVVVIEARGESGSGTLGDILALRAKSLGATGVITDGGVRDSAEVAEILPVFATAKNPAVLGRKHVPWESDVAVACGNATVLPGDVIVADDDGAIVIPRDLVEEVVDAALAKEVEDGWVAEQVAAGNPIEGLFPPKGEWKAKFDEWKASQ